MPITMPHGQLSLFYTFNFYVFGIIAVVAALLFVTRRSPVAAAMWLVVTMFALAVLFIMLDAQFIGAIQVLVYAGAIMVVFLFVIMLLNLGDPGAIADARGTGWKLVATAVGIILLAQIFALTRVHVAPSIPTGALAREIEQRGVLAPIAQPLFNSYLLAFEVTSVLLLAAIVGAVVLAKRRTNAG
ncbi:MAG TPA: NADH-quinone oxidoreductase subunit J [Gemmatimonadaceae bacterium]|nr:NADH-quinone oxidoreductase subunit J [Gemmatimonadaceae bacterium]